MEDKEAAEILLALTKKYPLTEPEREAVSAALGMLTWSTLWQTKVKKLGKKRREQN